jgi:protein-disulfide isomerase
VRASASPSQASALVPVTDQPAWGPPDAPVTVTLFADLECPHTRAELAGLVRLKTDLGDDLRWVFRHRPLSQHPDGARAAQLLAAAGEQLGPAVFWKLVSELSADPDSDASEIIELWLAKSSIAAPRRAELETLPAGQARVEADLALGAQLFVRATPTLFVNGRRLDGFQDENDLGDAVRHERRAGLFELIEGTPADEVYAARTQRNLINVGDDPAERVCVPEHGAPVRGPAQAPVSIVHFCAYESSYCRQAEPALSAILGRHKDEVRVAWRGFPITPDGNGRVAAGFALAARKAGGDKAFWLVHRALLDARAAVDAPALAKVVEGLGMDAERLLSAARSGEHDARIDADIELGRKLSVSGVPTSFVNGRRHDGLLNRAELEALVREELLVAKRVAASGRTSVNAAVCSARGER